MTTPPPAAMAAYVTAHCAALRFGVGAAALALAAEYPAASPAALRDALKQACDRVAAAVEAELQLRDGGGG